MSPRPLVLLEFNELSPPLMDEFIGKGLLPNFARLRNESFTYVTDAGEDPPHLNPWIQWVTVHTGAAFAEHRVFHLGDATKSGLPMIWDKVCAAGSPVWVCGSMNVSVQEGFRGWLLPDPWDASSAPHPAEFNDYMKLVRAYVFEHTRGKRPVTLRAAAQFLAFMLRHGLSFGTVASLANQLLQERFADVAWRRASILDLLQFDVFRSVYKKHKPLLSTFFLNSTAHYQHAYWRNMQPELFRIKPSESEQKSRSNAILFGYQVMDRLVGEVLRMVSSDTVVAFVTALSQQPCLAWESDGGKTFYKPHDTRTLLEFVGIDPTACRVEPVMSEQFHVRFADEASAQRGKQLLDAMTLDSAKPVMGSRLEGRSVFTGCAIFGDLPGGTMLQAGAKGARFTDIFYQIEAIKSGMHHRDGMFWIRHPERNSMAHPGRLSLTAIMPMLLNAMRLAEQASVPAATAPVRVA